MRPQIEFPFANTKIFKLEKGIELAMEYGLKKLSSEIDFRAIDIPNEKKSTELDLVFNGHDLHKLQSLYHYDYQFLGYIPIQIGKRETISLKELKQELSHSAQLWREDYDLDIVLDYEARKSRRLANFIELSSSLTKALCKTVLYPVVKK